MDGIDILINLKNFKNRNEIIELLNECMYASEEMVILEYERYMNDSSRRLLGISKNNELIGLIGIIYMNEEEVELKHIAIKPSERKKGIGKKLIMEFMNGNAIRRLEAETDKSAVNFYRSIGFQVSSLGEKYPGVERFKCVKNDA